MANYRDGEHCVPIYEYACKSCDHTLDALQKMNDDPLVECPECGEAALKRLISAPRFRLKGEGWYETDFKKDNQRNLAKADSDAAPSATNDAKSDTKSDSGGDAKKDATSPKKEPKKVATKKEATAKSDSS